jgi:hypothetical protein
MNLATFFIIEHGMLSRPDAFFEGIFAMVATTHATLKSLKLKLQEHCVRKLV